MLDTNVLFAAFTHRGRCAELYEKALATETLVSSDAILGELREKLRTKAKVSDSEASRVRAEVAEDCEVVPITALPEAVCRDPDDDAILATAIAAQADLLVTGDKDLLELETYKGISIVTPAACLARLSQSR